MTIKDKFVVTVCALLYLLYPTLTLSAFGLFTCIDVAGQNYLLADLSEECYAERHTTYVLAVGIPQLLLFVVGLPTAGLFFMIRNRERLGTTAVKARYGLFFGGYKNDRYYWEFFLVFRKVSVMMVSSFGVVISPEMQVLLLMMILNVCIAAQYLGQVCCCCFK